MLAIDEKNSKPLLKVTDLEKSFPIRGSFGKDKQYVYAVQGVSFELYEGEVYGLVGESGCGKSTTGRTILRLVEATSGTAELLDKKIFELNATELRDLRKKCKWYFKIHFLH